MSSGQCQICQGGGPDYGALAVVVGAMSLVLGYIYRQAGKREASSSFNMGIFTIAVNFAAISSILNAKGGPITKYFVGLFNFDTSHAIVYLCLNSFLSQYVVMLWVPVMYIAALGLVSRLHQGSNTWVPRWSQACVFVIIYSCMSVANLTISAFVCRDYIPGTMSLLTANPAIQCWKSEEHRIMMVWAPPFFLLFVVIGPLLITGRMFGWTCMSGLKAWVRVDFLQGSYKRKQDGDFQTLKQSCQTNFEILLLLRRVCLTAVTLFSASLCKTDTDELCTSKVVAVNAVLFASMIVHTVLMPFRNRVHNYLEIGSLVLNFLLFDIALLATSGSDGLETVRLVLDLVRVAAFLVLGGYGVYENRVSLNRLVCCSANEAEAENDEEGAFEMQKNPITAAAAGAAGSASQVAGAQIWAVPGPQKRTA
jgi:hypothetical protein